MVNKLAKNRFKADLSNRLETLKTDGLYKVEQTITSPQGGVMQLEDGKDYINLCANNYLGLSNHPELVKTAQVAIGKYGYGMSSVRFICGTQTPHKQLEDKLSNFLKMEDTILFPSCFDANTGLFETLLTHEDAIISDALNHASIIDGVRLCKAKRMRYRNRDMAHLEEQLQDSEDARYRLIATDGVFSMDGYIADLNAICNLAEKYDALVMVDDSHAVGFLGENGRGTSEFCDVMGRIDILTGTLGKALGGASGGYVSSSKEIVEWLRQRSRPYLFSNTLAPVIAETSLKVLDLLNNSSELREALWRNTAKFRTDMTKLGFELLPGEHAIIPLMLRDPQLAQDFVTHLRNENVFVAAFSFPVVPKEQDRIRTQMSASHSTEELDRAIAAFAKVGRQLNVIK
jgi:glycine C-acetyltransferase